MANADKTLQNKDHVNIYPITRERNVYDENNVNLKEKFKNVIFGDNEVFKFSQEQYEESANLFDEQVERGNVDNKTGLFTENSTGNNLVAFNYRPMKPNTVYSYKTSKSGLWIYEYDSNKNFLGYVDLVSGSSFTSKSNTAYFRVAFWGGYGTTYLNDAIVKEGTNPIYHPYNPNRHITNSEAEFLKDEHEASYNLWNNEEKGSIDESTGENVGNANRWRTKDYIEAIPNTQYSLSAVASSAIWLIFYFYTSSKAFISSDAKSGTSNITTTPNNCAYIRCVVADTASISSSNRQLTKSDKVLPYQPYNQASHITNAQADLLKSEYEKQKNIVDNDDFEKGDLVTHGTVESASDILARTKNFIEVKPNTKYTVSVGANKTELVGIKTYTSKNLSTGQTLDPREIYTFPYTFTIPDGVNYIKVVIKPLDMTTLNDKQIQIEEGEVATSYHNGEGEIVRKGDIEPVTLFEGASNGDINLRESILNFENIEIWYGYSGSLYSVKLNTKLIDIGGSVKLLQPTGDVSGSNTGISFRLNSYSIAENKLTYEYSVRFYSYANGSPTVDTNNNVFIKKVLGFKY